MKPLEVELALIYCKQARAALSRISEIAGGPERIDNNLALLSSRLREVERLVQRQVGRQQR